MVNRITAYAWVRSDPFPFQEHMMQKLRDDGDGLPFTFRLRRALIGGEHLLRLIERVMSLKMSSK